MAGAVKKLLENREMVTRVVRGARATGFPKHRGVLSKLLELRASEDPNRVGLYIENGGAYPDDRLTYAKLWADSLRLAGALRAEGFERGDKLAIVMRNHAEFLYAWAACSMLGTVLVPIDPRGKGEKLVYQLGDSDAKAVITTGDLLLDVSAAVGEVAGVEKIYVSLKPGDDAAFASGYQTVNEWLDRREVFGLDNRVDDVKAPVQIIYTSGVTGNPKGVTLDSLRNAMYCLLGFAVWDYKPDDRLYTGLSLAHGNAQAVTVIPGFNLKLPVVISQRFTKSRIWDVCRAYGCTSFSLLGGMMAGIFNERPRPDDAANPVRMVISAGTPLAIWEEFENRFDVKILEWYGAIEGGLAFKPVGLGPLGSFGKPIPCIMEMKVVDEADNEVAPGIATVMSL
ncbi:MAG: AMP-binding protein [Candidatus Geothermincolia bacterium]